MQLSASPSLRLEDADATILPVLPSGQLPTVTRQVAAEVGLDLAEISIRFGLKEAGDHCWVATGASFRGGDLLLVQTGDATTGIVTASSLRAATTRAARIVGRRHVACLLAAVPLDPATSGRVVTEAFIIGAYRYDRYQTRASGRLPAPDQITIAGVDSVVVERSRIVAEATNLARDLTNAPPNDLTPGALADVARQQAAQHGFEVRVIENEELTAGQFGGLVGVGAASANPPVLIELFVGDPTGPHTALVGKGITFDTGGLDLKQLARMTTMKCDMAGAAAILAAIVAVCRLGDPASVRGYLACAENMPGSRAMRPGDVLTHRNGISTELVSPDAEGRLVLADALAFAAEHGPERMIDVATLTGSTALGADLWAVMATDRALAADLIQAGNAAGEPGWELPLWTNYRSAVLSDIADVKNLQLGITQDFGSILGALYLREFVGGTPWAHVDIGETAFREEDGDGWAAGATGSLTRTLIGYLAKSKL